MFAILFIIFLVLIASYMFWKSRRNQQNIKKFSTLKVSRKIHKWLMLFIGLQFLIWSISGAYMVIFDIDYIHGDSLVSNSQSTINHKKIEFSLQDLFNNYPDAKNIEVGKLINEDVYRFTQNNQKYLVNSWTGQQLSPLNQEIAENLAIYHYSGDAPITNVALITENPPFELNPEALPAWRVNFDAFGSPSIYISAQTGKLVGKRHEFWRIFDWMFRFHVMDYDDGGDIDNLLLFWITLTGMTAALSGLILTFLRVFKPNSGEVV